MSRTLAICDRIIKMALIKYYFGVSQDYFEIPLRGLYLTLERFAPVMQDRVINNFSVLTWMLVTPQNNLYRSQIYKGVVCTYLNRLLLRSKLTSVQSFICISIVSQSR